MSLDPIFLEAVVAELRERLANAAVSKIHQVGPHELVLRLWTGRENLRLFLGADPRAPRLHLTAGKLPNPQTPPRFCQLLRSRLRRLQSIARLPGERIVRLVFSGEAGSTWILVAELLPGRANLLLLDDQERLVDSLVRREGLLPGAPYQPPPAIPRYDLDAELPVPPADRPLRPWLLEEVAPMTPLLAEDLEAAVAAGVPAGEALAHLAGRWRGRTFTPAIVTRPGETQLTALLPEYLELAAVERFDSPSQAADAFFAAAPAAATFVAAPGELERVVRKELRRLAKRLQQIAAEEERAHQAGRQRELGDLLLANLHALQRGMEQVTVQDWYADPPAAVTIPLDPALAPQQNVERFFRLARKGKRALEHIARRRAETGAEQEWLEGVLLALDETETPDDLAALRDELAAAGLLKLHEPLRRPRPAGEEPLRRAVTPGGFQLIWGKNNRSNDQVSCRLTARDDLWFHAHGLPGCHLVLKRGGRSGPIPEADLLYAASLAAGYSRGRESAKVEVSVCEGRWVKKPPGARPGLVTVEQYRTVVVAPRRLAEGEE